MGKEKTKSQKIKQNTGKNYLVFTKFPENYKMFDLRANKPICYISNPIKGDKGSMVLQEIDTIEVQPQRPIEKRIRIDYFAPNNVGVLLSIAYKALMMAKKLFEEYIISDTPSKSTEGINSDKKRKIIMQSELIYDYIEQIQTCIVFGYTALEAFSNLSIPKDYDYKTELNGKGIVEIYDKEAIERWTPLKVKISEILTDVYKTKPIKGLKVWNKFLELEDLRHEIIHQKSINHTNFLKKYFRKNIFELCTIPEEIIKFFFDNREDKDATNPLWPWVINCNNDFPVSYEFESEKFEITGNLHEGF